MTYVSLKKDISSQMRNSKSCCSVGYAALLRTRDADGLARVCIKYWADLNRSLWPQFQSLLRKHYFKVRDTFHAYGIFYNESSDSGYCVVDDDAAPQLSFHRKAVVVAHGSASVLLRDNVSATLFDQARAIARDTSRVTAFGYSSVTAYDSTRIRAHDNAHVESNGTTTIFSADRATLSVTHAYRIDSPPSPPSP